jgi:hypothetical protein
VQATRLQSGGVDANMTAAATPLGCKHDRFTLIHTDSHTSHIATACNSGTTRNTLGTLPSTLPWTAARAKARAAQAWWRLGGALAPHSLEGAAPATRMCGFTGLPCPRFPAPG